MGWRIAWRLRRARCMRRWRKLKRNLVAGVMSEPFEAQDRLKLRAPKDFLQAPLLSPLDTRGRAGFRLTWKGTVNVKDPTSGTEGGAPTRWPFRGGQVETVS